MLLLLLLFPSRLSEEDLDILQDVRFTSRCHNNSKLDIYYHLHCGKLSRMRRSAEKSRHEVQKPVQISLYSYSYFWLSSTFDGLQ